MVHGREAGHRAIAEDIGLDRGGQRLCDRVGGRPSPSQIRGEHFDRGPVRDAPTQLGGDESGLLRAECAELGVEPPADEAVDMMLRLRVGDDLERAVDAHDEEEPTEPTPGSQGPGEWR